jgi:DNA-binding transcriptional LysR family regulator
MNVNHLQYFVTLAELEHYTKASDRLGISQPNLSHAIHALEDELEVKLFQKKGRNITLTKYGDLFLEYAQTGLDSLDAGKRKLQEMAGGTSGNINLAYIYTLGSSLAPKLVREFLEMHLHYKVTFQFSVGNTSEILKGLRKEIYDIAFCSKEPYEEDIEFIPFIKETLVVVLPKNHPLCAQEGITLREIENEPLITFTKSSGLRRTIEKLYETNKVIFKSAYEIGEDSSIAGLVSEGFGVAIMPKIPMLNSFSVEIRPLEATDYERYIYLAYVRDKYRSPMANHFISFIKNIQIEK